MMMYEVKRDGDVIAIFGDVNEIGYGTTFYGSSEQKLQFSVLRWKKGTIFQNHIHKYRPRTIEQTQESWVVLKGAVKVFVFDESKELIHEQMMTAGQFYISYRGGHGYEILEDDTCVIENKLGDFVGVDADKEKF